MGDMADDMVEGLTCSGCGKWFEDSHGYPVLCRRCYKQERRIRRGGKPDLQRATIAELGEHTHETQ